MDRTIQIEKPQKLNIKVPLKSNNIFHFSRNFPLLFSNYIVNVKSSHIPELNQGLSVLF